MTGLVGGLGPRGLPGPPVKPGAVALCGVWCATCSVTFMCWPVAAHVIGVSSSSVDKPADRRSRITFIFIFILSIVFSAFSAGGSGVWSGSVCAAEVDGLLLKINFTTLYSVFPQVRLKMMRYGHPRQKHVASQYQTEPTHLGLLPASVYVASRFSKPTTVLYTKKLT